MSGPPDSSEVEGPRGGHSRVTSPRSCGLSSKGAPGRGPRAATQSSSSPLSGTLHPVRDGAGSTVPSHIPGPQHSHAHTLLQAWNGALGTSGLMLEARVGPTGQQDLLGSSPLLLTHRGGMLFFLKRNSSWASTNPSSISFLLTRNQAQAQLI